MASPFAAIERLTAKVVERVNGEPVQLLPKREGKYSSGGSDPDRSPRTVVGIVTKDNSQQRTDGVSLGPDFGFNMVAGELRISLDLALFSSPADWPRKGDHVQLMDRVLQPLYEVVLPEPDNTNRLLLRCSKVAKP